MYKEKELLILFVDHAQNFLAWMLLDIQDDIIFIWDCVNKEPDDSIVSMLL